ncbi:MAG: glycosyltransferase family 39 protein [Anaerolineae bacterium]
MSRKVALGGIILLGFALRLFHLNTVALRGDEAFTVIHWMREPLAQTLANIATVDPQAPLSYALYRGWALVLGSNEIVVRFLPALVSILGIPAMYALGHRLRGARLGLLAAFVWAINPYQIYHAQDARSYAVWAALSLIAIWLALRALDKQRRIDWLLYIAAGALAAYVYYLELFIILALNLYVFATRWRDRPLLARWLGAEIAIGLLLAPWYLQPRLLFSSGYGGTAGQFAPPQLLTRFIPTLTFSTPDKLPPDTALALAAVLGIALLVGLAVWWRRNRGQALLVGLLGTLPAPARHRVDPAERFRATLCWAQPRRYVLILCALVVSLRETLGGWQRSTGESACSSCPATISCLTMRSLLTGGRWRRT